MYAQWKTVEKDWLVRQVKIILDALVEEIMEDDRAVFGTPTAQLMIINFSKLLQWTVTGNMAELPEELWPIACQIEGVEIPMTITVEDGPNNMPVGNMLQLGTDAERKYG